MKTISNVQCTIYNDECTMYNDECTMMNAHAKKLIEVFISKLSMFTFYFIESWP